VFSNPRRRATPAGRAIGLVPAALVAGLALVLAGCTSAPAAPSAPTPTATAAEDAREPAGEPAAPVETEPGLVPDGDADDNLPYFNLVNARLLGSDPTPGGRPIVDNLVAAGFDRANMQVTPDATAIGGEVDSVQFSVRFGDRCLIGQSGDSGYAGIEGPVVADSICLAGATRSIDW